MTDGGLAVGDSAFIGYSGTGNFTQSGGTNTISDCSLSRLQLRQQRNLQPQRPGLLSAPVEYVG